MKSKEVRNLDDGSSSRRVREFRDELFNLRFQQRDGRAREHGAPWCGPWRALARTLTVAHERGIDVERELARQRKAEES